MSGQQRRLSSEEGLSLVEMLIAMLVISIGLLALVSSFAASARSLQAQKTLTGATRVASTVLEEARAVGYDLLPVGAQPATDIVHNGITYSVAQTVTVRDVDGDSSDPDDGDDVKEIELVVTWQDIARTRTHTYRTSVARPSTSIFAVAGPALGDLSVSPTSVEVDENGDTTEAVSVTVPVSGFSVGDSVTLTWTDSDGSHTTDPKMWTEGVAELVFDIAAGGIDVDGIPEGGSESLTFTATSGSLTKSVSMTLRNPSDTPVVVTSADIEPTPLRVASVQGNCGGTSQCTNVDELVFSAHVSGLDTSLEVDSVRVRVPLQNGSNAEIVLIRDAVDLTLWSVTIEPGQLKVRASDTSATTQQQTFTFIARRQSDGVEGSLDLSHPVLRQ